MRKQEFNSKHLPSPARRGSRSRTASPPASLAIRKAPSASVESIQPRPPRPCEVGRPKGRRRKSRRQSHKFFKHRRSGWHPNSPATPWGGSPLRPLCQKICYSDCTENCPLSPLRAPRRFRNPRFPFTSTPSPPASLPIRKAPSASVESIEPRPPRPCEVGRPKGRRRKNRCNLTIFLAPTQRVAPQLAATPWGGSPPRPLCQKICYSDCTENCPLCPLRAPRRFRNPRFPFTRNLFFTVTSTAAISAPFPHGTLPSSSVESIQPRPPRPCEVGRPKGRRRKNRRQSHKFFKHRRSG